MSYCVQCGSPLPENQGSKTCSMCYGQVEHGRDGYYREWLEQAWLDDQRAEEERIEQERRRSEYEAEAERRATGG